MNEHDISADDISAVLDQGDYLGLLKSLAAPRTETRRARDTRPVPGGESFPRTPPPRTRPDSRPVGTWPTGCGRPGDPIPTTAA